MEIVWSDATLAPGHVDRPGTPTLNVQLYGDCAFGDQVIEAPWPGPL